MKWFIARAIESWATGTTPKKTLHNYVSSRSYGDVGTARPIIELMATIKLMPMLVEAP